MTVKWGALPCGTKIILCVTGKYSLIHHQPINKSHSVYCCYEIGRAEFACIAMRGCNVCRDLLFGDLAIPTSLHLIFFSIQGH